jgi:hypothetical protein
MGFFRTSLLVGGPTVLLALGAAAQTPSPQSPGLPSELMAKLARLRDAALTSDYAWQQVGHLTETSGRGSQDHRKQRPR